MPYQRGGTRLLEIARELGYTYLRTSRGGRHALLAHGETAAVVCVPLNVSEAGRNFDNYRLSLQRAAATATAEGAATPRQRRQRRPTGEAIARAERIAARMDNASHARMCAAIERQDQRVRFYATLMTRRFAG